MPAPARSGIPKSMGVLLIVFASIYMLSSLVAAAMTLLGGSFMDIIPKIGGSIPELKKSGINLEALLGQLKPLYTIQGAEKLAVAAISGFGLMAGIKLSQYTEQGLRLAVMWALSALGYIVIEILVFIFFIQPIITKFFSTISKQVGPLLGKEKEAFDLVMGLAGSTGLGGVLVGAFFMAIFPVLMLVLLNTDAAKKACGVQKVFG